MSKRTGGRPPKYKTKKEIQEKIDQYFESCQGILLKDENNKPVYTDKGMLVYLESPKPPTVTGLALALGFTTRTSLLNYQGKAEFMDTITRAKTYIEEYTERRLFDRDGVQGAKFSLVNNFKGWSERHELAVSDGPVQNRAEDDPITKTLKEELQNGSF